MADVPDWWQSVAPGAEVRPDEHELVSEFFHNANLDFRNVTILEHVVIRVRALQDLQLALVATPEQVRVVIEVVGSLDLLMARCTGPIEIIPSPQRASGHRPTVSIAQAEAHDLSAEGVDLAFNDLGGSLVMLAIEHLSVTANVINCERLVVKGRCRLDSPVQVYDLTLLDGAIIHGKHAQCTELNVDGSVVLRSGSGSLFTVNAKETRGGRVQIGASAQLSVENEVRGATILGQGTFAFETSAVGEHLVFHGTTLELGQNSLVSDVSGEVRLGKCEAATILASTEGLGVLDTGPSSSYSRASLQRIRVDYRGVAGAKIWSGLREADYVVPIIRGTPVTFYRWEYLVGIRYWIAARSEWALRHDPLLKNLSVDAVEPFGGLGRQNPLDRRLHPEMEYVRTLATLADEKGAPGNIRTAATWAAYRLRALTTPSRVERFVLGLYRLIGYGERPLPALTMWLLAVVVASVATLSGAPWQGDWDGVVHVLNVLGYWAVPSFSLINQPELPDVKKDVGHFLVHILIAVPFVTGLLALRNYVKADRPNR